MYGNAMDEELRKEMDLVKKAKTLINLDTVQRLGGSAYAKGKQ